VVKAVTYLGSLVEGLSVGFKYAFVAGAVRGSSLRYLTRSYLPGGIAGKPECLPSL
jgi:hypothetical protein